MCGRYILTYEKQQDLTEFINAVDKGIDLGNEKGDAYSNYNVAPTHEMPVAFVDENGERVLKLMHWGFMGWKPKEGDKPFTPINTRDDKVTSSRMWKAPFLTKRCIVPASGFYEWSGSKGNKTPHFIYPTEGKFLGFAGLYSDIAPDSSGVDKSYSIITTSPNKVMKKIHDRMPVILHQEEFEDWLNPKNDDPEYLIDFLQPYPDDWIQEHIVSKAVGSVSNNEPSLIEKTD